MQVNLIHFVYFSFGEVLGGLDKNLIKTFSGFIEDKVVKQSLKVLQCPIGVLVRKGEAEMQSIRKIAFIYTGAPYEAEALKIISSIPSKIALTVISSTEFPVHERENFSLISATNVMESFVSGEAEKQDYDLVVMGANR